MLWACLFFILAFFERGHGLGVEGYEIEQPEIPVAQAPWFTGNLLSPSAYIVPFGYMSVEPYFVAGDTFGHYNSHWKAKSNPDFWTINPQFYTWIGLGEKIDFQFAPNFFWNETQGKSATRFGDLPIGFNIQILEEKKGRWWPAIKLTLRETFPTGKYQKLNPHKLSTDATGTGSYITGIGLAFGKLFHFKDAHYLASRFFVSYSVPSRVHVQGFNSYGGGFGTDGYVYPGWYLTNFIGFEYSLTRNWALALDIVNIYNNKTRFKGIRGKGMSSGSPLLGIDASSMGGEATVGAPSSYEVSLAPAIEYNFSEWLGVIAGCWFSVAGRNTSQYAIGMLAVSYYFQITKTKPHELPHLY